MKNGKLLCRIPVSWLFLRLRDDTKSELLKESMAQRKAYVSDLITYYHLASVISYCIYNKINDLEVFAITSMNGDRLLKEGFYVLGGIRIRISYCAGKKTSIINVVFAVISRIRFRVSKVHSDAWIGHHSYFKPNWIANEYGSKANTFSFEEGIGTFGNLSYHRNVARREDSRFPVLKFITKKMLSTKFFVDSFWFPMAEDDEVKIRVLKQAFELIGREFFKSLACELESFSNKPIVVILGAPLVRLGLIEAEEYKKILMDLVSRINLLGCFPVYKAHHLETAIDIHPSGIVLRTSAPAEVLISMLSTKWVVGFSSSALISTSKIFNVDAYNAANLLPAPARNAIGLDGSLKSIFDSCVSDFEL
tara:strand:- start:320 stop:1411 length:1092 start_codon:yes stop_codon:yes gene_type:complete